MKARIGIDPGAAGACVALLDNGTIKEIRFGKVTQKEISDFFMDLAFEDCYCVLELVGAMPGNGNSSMFTFGKNVGFIIGLLVASGIPYQETVPRSWQKALGIQPRFKPKKGEPGKEETKPDFKKRLKQKSEQLFPAQKITTDTADAYLIAEFCKRMYP